MNLKNTPFKLKPALLLAALLGASTTAYAADQELLDILLQNGAITTEQYDALIEKDSLSSGDVLPVVVLEKAAEEAVGEVIEQRVATEIARQIDEEFPVTASETSSGFRLATRDGNWRTELQWRAQTRFTTPYRSDPRQIRQFQCRGTVQLRSPPPAYENWWSRLPALAELLFRGRSSAVTGCR